MNKENGHKKIKAVNLSTDYLVFSSLAFCFILLSIFFLVINFFNSLDVQLAQNISAKLNSVADTVFVVSESNNDTSALNLPLKKLLTQSMSYYNFSAMVLKENRTDKIVASTIPGLYEGTISDIQLESRAIMSDMEYFFRKNDKYTLFISYDKDLSLNTNRIKMQMDVLLICALLLCLALSWILSQRIINPINKIKNAAKEYSKGDFSLKIEETKYKELNELVDTFNEMATKLDTFYKTLEQKVKDRTKELEQALSELKNAQSMMVHSEKMKSLGELAAGIMHEVNNPINFIYGNLIHLDNYSKDLTALIDDYSELDNDLSKEKLDKAIEFKKEIDYDFLKEDLPALIHSCREGTERTKNIVQDLKNFSRLDANVVSTVSLEKEIDTTLNILHNKLKNRIEVHKEYAPNMPKIDCLGGQLNQVFMNILDNAAFAIKDKGDIYIRLNFDDKYALIEFEDNGCGMSKKTAEKIFDPFFTTKPVGQGTGLGMSISYKVIKTHSGEITVSSEEGKGTIFKIKLPIEYTPDEHALAR